jgi:type I restriction enzyme S subunit
MSQLWPMVALGQVIQHRKEFIEIDDFAQYKRCRVQLHAQGIVLRDTVQGVEIKTKQQQVCQAGEFLVAEIDAKLGGYGIVPEELDGAIVSSHYFLYVIDETKLDRRFLSYFIRTHDFFDQVSAKGSTNYAAIRPHHVLEYKILLPPLDEQRRIVARIEVLAAKVEQAQRLRQRSAGEVERLSVQAYALAWESQNGIIKLLGEVAEVIDPQPDHRTPAKMEGGLPYASIKDIDLKGNVNFSTARKVSEEAIAKQEAAFTLQTGDIVLGKIGTIGAARPLTVEGRFALSANIVLVQPNRNEIDEKFLLHLLRAPQIEEQFQKESRRTAQVAFGIQKMRKLRIPVPSLSEQHHIVAYLDNLQAKVEAVKRHQAATAGRLESLLPSILDRAFRGEL